MKRLLCALLACLMLTAPILTGCDNDKDADNTAATTTENPQDQQPPEEPDPKDAKYDSITIDGVNLSEYQIVYASDELTSKANQYPDSSIYGETHYTKLIAEELAADLKNMTGIDVPVVASSAAATDHEILVGRTGHSDEENSRINKEIAADVYKIAMLEPGKLWLNGGSPAAMYDTLGVLYTEFMNQDAKDVVIPGTFVAQAKADVITVSCIGDSITDGFGTKDASYCAWPAIAGRILWKDYAFSNFGVSGTTMRDDHKDAYVDCWKYDSMIEAAPTADITLIMLGTNDSDRFKNWTTADTEKYTADYTAFVDMLTELNPDTHFVLMNCPEYYNGTGKDGEFGSDKMVALQKKIFETFKEEGRNVSFFDMHSFTANDMGKDMFYDGLHPSDLGYSEMAKGVCEMLTALADEAATNKYLTK